MNSTSTHSAQAVALHVELDPRISFAMQQNDVPVIKALRIENGTRSPLRQIELRITSEPAFAQSWCSRIEAVAENASLSIDAVDLQLSPAYLDSLTERVQGCLVFELLQGETLLAARKIPVQLLARDEWGGLASLPEILAAFVLPNHPGLETVLQSAASHLLQWTGNPALNGYQSRDPRRVHMMSASVYAALCEQRINYVNPPASFEEQGQRVRLPDRIFGSRMAACLDMALLAAGCLETAGLHPLVIVVRGHAFTGLWLQEETFSEPVVTERLRLSKRVALNEIAVFDPTGTTATPALDFERAVAEARRQLDNEADFLCVLDVKRARKGQIRPLPECVSHDAPDDAPHPPSDSAALALEPPDVSQIPLNGGTALQTHEPDPENETPETRLDRWRRKLLDLSLRNRLLNFRDTKKTLPLFCPDLARFEDMLAAGATFRILPRPADLGAIDPRDSSAHARRTGEDAFTALLREELEARRLYAAATKADLDRRLTEIFRAARLGLEEGGASALYLAIGFLAWYETPHSTQRRLAPILLLPLELNRRSIREGFSLKLAEEDPRINVTLLEMLKQVFGMSIPGLDPLPEGESGLDVPKILHTLRLAVRDIDRWEIVEEVCIGLFSFTKFLMWRDLSDRAQQLVANPVVDHLVNQPNQPFDPDVVFPNPDNLDDERSPDKTFCPLPADSSQLAAVFAAAEGRSFVLKGPPGTGKSQTITNLIAHCLANGQTVLFVSEKMAALHVVHRRLVQIGLARYCLELHSNKAHKQTVIDQLEAALDRGESRNVSDWEHEAQRLTVLRDELNAYVRALHLRRATGETVFQATSRSIGLRDVPRVALHWPEPDSLDAKALETLRDLVSRLETTACGEPKGHAWEAVRHGDWTPSWLQSVRDALAELNRSVETLSGHVSACADPIKLDANGASLHALDLLDAIARSMMGAPGCPQSVLTRSDWNDLRSRLDDWIAQGRSRDDLRARLRQTFRESILSLDLDDLLDRLHRAHGARRLQAWWLRRSVRNALKGVAVDGKAPPIMSLVDVLERAHAWRERQRKLDADSNDAVALLGQHWKDGEADWNVLQKIRNWADHLRALALSAAGDDFEKDGILRHHWAQLADTGLELLKPDGRLGRQFSAYMQALETFRNVRKQVVDLLELDAVCAWGDDSVANILQRMCARITSWQEALPALRDWCAWQRARAEGIAHNLAPLIEAFEQGNIRRAQLAQVFERSYTQWWLDAITDREPTLSQFFSPEHERKIQQFRDTDERYTRLTRDLIQAKLAQRLPAMVRMGAMPNSEMGILKREIGKRRRHLPVRQLLQKIPNLLPRLKPCLLMSPMSVAQYLDAEYPPFDLVVFDEASQIPVWDAVGAIARGRQAVIVGDPQQLPPTTFFQRETDDEELDLEDDVQDLESILDDCIGAQIPTQSLHWHYRSRHESLIAFSNHNYYNDQLLTFPSPVLQGLGVNWRHVPDGVYDRGKTRTNRAEAEAVVAETLRRLKEPNRSPHTIGIVTFSQAQQTLIEDLFDKARSDDPLLDVYFADDGDEPVFVKNLENVQGDERDVIFFSIGYGPDVNGRVAMTFGPMNRDGGERRLNVAITRARREVLVFSTLKSEQIDLARSNKRGIRDLKQFLEYAERGPSAIGGIAPPRAETESNGPFEQFVQVALVKHGWQVHPQVGSARYRIDLAVVDPENPDRYLMGIECDGPNYHCARTARDRDKLRNGVLKDLGWNLHRIWSADWWADPEREIRKLEDLLLEAKTDRVSHPTESPRPHVAPTYHADSQAAQPNASDHSNSQAETTTTNPSSSSRPLIKRYSRIPEGTPLGSVSDFYQTQNLELLQTRIVEVVEHEGPISLPLAARRVAAAWGIERMSPKTLGHIRQCVPADAIHIQDTDNTTFLWTLTTDPSDYRDFRVPDETDGEIRSLDDLPLEELANAVVYLLQHHMSAPIDELVRETARLFGFQRVGPVMDTRIREAIDKGISCGRLRRLGALLALGKSE